MQIILPPSPCLLLPDGTVPEVLLLRGLHRLDLGTQVHVFLILAEVHLRKVLESTASLCKSMVNLFTILMTTLSPIEYGSMFQ